MNFNNFEKEEEEVIRYECIKEFSKVLAQRICEREQKDFADPLNPRFIDLLEIDDSLFINLLDDERSFEWLAEDDNLEETLDAAKRLVSSLEELKEHIQMTIIKGKRTDGIS